MSPSSKSQVFFTDNTFYAETWMLGQITKAAQHLVDSGLGLYAFIQSDEEQDNHFVIALLRTPNEPLLVYEATIVNQDTAPQLTCKKSKQRC